MGERTTTRRAYICSYCGVVERGKPEYAIHRDGLDQGPEVPLCPECGQSDQLSCDTIWRFLRAQKSAPQPNRTLN